MIPGFIRSSQLIEVSCTESAPAEEFSTYPNKDAKAEKHSSNTDSRVVHFNPFFNS